MKILKESEIRKNPHILWSLWQKDQSFILIPTPPPVEDEWLISTISRLPQVLQNNHYGILTSGSTGTPKLIVGSKQRSEYLTSEIAKLQNLANVESTILCLPLSYSYSLINQWLWASLNKKKIIYTEGLVDPEKLIKALSTEESSMICFVGSQFLLFEKYLNSNMTFPNVKCVNFAGGLFPQEALSRLKSLFPQAEIYHNYGCTEALPRLTIRKAETHADPYILGTPLKGISLSIDENSKLKFRSPYSAVAICSPEKISFIDDNLEIDTGDLAEILQDGHIKLLGRSNEIFKRHGEKISLSSIKEKIRQVHFSPFATYSTMDSTNELAYVLVLTNQSSPEDLKIILKCFREHFKRTHWPLRIEHTESLPISLNGKIDSQKLKYQQLKILWKQHI